MFKLFKGKQQPQHQATKPSIIVASEMPPSMEKPRIKQTKDGNISVLSFDVEKPNQKNLKSLGEPNPQYIKPTINGTRRNEYEYINYNNSPVEFDNNNVIVGGVVVGTVPSDARALLSDILENKNVTSKYASIHSGNYLLITETQAFKEQNYIYCTIRIRYK